MTPINRNWLLSLAAAIVACAGCASAYHSYSGCEIPCQYCVPSPLPYQHYSDCACHSCAAAPYVNASERW